jgi:hypothetical protein
MNMKKLMTLFLLVVGLSMAMPASAQFKWGVKGGLNISKPSLSGKTIREEAKNNTGYFIGPMGEITILVIGLGVDGSLLYSHKGAVDVDDKTVNLNTLEIPINLKYTIGLGSLAGIYIAAGPQYGYNLGKKNVSGLKLESSTVSANVGAGVKLLGHLQAGFNYNFALDKTGKSKTEDVDFKTNTWQISVAYLF